MCVLDLTLFLTSSFPKPQWDEQIVFCFFYFKFPCRLLYFIFISAFGDLLYPRCQFQSAEKYVCVWSSAVCDYCSTGDLHTCWLLRSHFGEEEVRLIAAELGSALG